MGTKGPKDQEAAAPGTSRASGMREVIRLMKSHHPSINPEDGGHVARQSKKSLQGVLQPCRVGKICRGGVQPKPPCLRSGWLGPRLRSTYSTRQDDYDFVSLVRCRACASG